MEISGTDGEVQWRYDYDAFGNERSIAGQDSSQDTNPFRYCGEYYDTETGKLYLRARYYDPTIGRFMSEDPAHDGLNWYVYCENNPIKYWDPSGNSPELVAESLNLAQELALADGPIPVGDLIAAGVLVFAGGVWVWDNKEAIWDGIQWTGRAIGGWFMSKSDRVDWDVNDNTKNHILKGSKNGHVDGWKKFGIDPNDPNSFLKLLPFLKKAVDKGEEAITKLDNGGRIIEYVHYIKDKAFEMVVRIFEYPDGTRILTDAYEKTK